MIKQIDKAGHIKEYCDICQRETDDTCKKCKNYIHPMFSQDITGQTYYHGYKEAKKHDSI